MIGDGRLIRSGELHYPRIPRAYWASRLAMAYAMGLDTVSTYVFWNVHEERRGDYDFSDQRDVAEFVRIAANQGLDVILRPGPYVCAEWDFGGLPAWLLEGDGARVRTRDESYMAPVRRWLARLGEELAPLQRSRGGPIIAVQLENEYGAFGNDARYLHAMREALDGAGFGDSPYFTIDQPADLKAGALPGIPAAVTFAPGNLDAAMASLRTLRDDAPLACGEYWAGWFDHWGEPHADEDVETQVHDVRRMLTDGCSLNVYMFHGGTNTAFYNGANTDDRTGAYRPDVTSYDYLAALDEAGRPTPKYYAFRDAISEVTGIPQRRVPPVPRTIGFPRCRFTESAALDGLLLAPPVESADPRSMEDLGQSFGYTLYRTTLQGAGEGGTLDLGPVRDFATIALDGRVAGTLDRRLEQTSLFIEPGGPSASRLDILIENCGRINYGPHMGADPKGLRGPVRFNGQQLHGWRQFTLPMNDLSALAFSAIQTPDGDFPQFFRARFHLEEPGDTFLDTRTLGKGVLFVNGHNAGRYWSIGPQRALYVPAVWLRAGYNDVVVFEISARGELFTEGVAEPIIGV
jgi:beta-galactosidase